jgi:hypothetical protein
MEEAQLKKLQSLYAGRHKSFLATQHPKAYAQMHAAGTLEEYLRTIGAQAADHYQTLEDQMLEQAKAIENPREREDYINRIPLVVSEIVREEIVHVKP